MIRHLPRSLKQVPPSLIPTAVEEIEGEERDIMLLGAPESDRDDRRCSSRSLYYIETC